PEHDRRATSSRPDEGHDLLRRVSSRFDGAPNRAYDGPRTVAGRATKGRSAGQRRTVIRPLSVPPVGRAPAAEIWGDDGGPWARRGGPRRRPHAGLRLRRDRAWPERDLGGDEGRQRRPRGIHHVGSVRRILSERLPGVQPRPERPGGCGDWNRGRFPLLLRIAPSRTPGQGGDHARERN